MGKVAGRTFDLKELEELCTKFLKYRIDSKNLVHFLKNTTKYDTPDLKEVVISRFVKDASNGFESDQVLELSEQELLSIMERKPEVATKKVMDVLIRWARKIYKAEKKIEDLQPNLLIKKHLKRKMRKKRETSQLKRQRKRTRNLKIKLKRRRARRKKQTRKLKRKLLKRKMRILLKHCKS